MSRTWAKIAANNMVENIIVADEEFISSQEGTWIETFDNPTANTGYNRASVGFHYNPEAHAFFGPRTADKKSHILDETFTWVIPTPCPIPDWWKNMSEEEKRTANNEVKSSVVAYVWDPEIGEWVDKGLTMADDPFIRE